MSAPTATAAARCPRCGGTFHCGAAGPGPCPCAGIDLSAAQQVRLRQQFVGCVCLDCLRALAQTEVVLEGAWPAPQAGP